MEGWGVSQGVAIFPNDWIWHKYTPPTHSSSNVRNRAGVKGNLSCMSSRSFSAAVTARLVVLFIDLTAFLGVLDLVFLESTQIRGGI